MEDYINDHPQMKRHKRFRFSKNEVNGSIRDLIMFCYEAMDDAGYNRFRLCITENGTPALEFYEGMAAPRIVTEEQENHSWLSRLLRRKDGKA